MNEIAAALIGIFGLILGASLNELMRRGQRIESYAPGVFAKRLEKYEELMNRLQLGYEVASDVMQNPKYSPQERHKRVSVAILNIASFTDENELYIDQDLAAHCVCVFMGAEDVMGFDDEKKREEERQQIRDMYTNAKQLIREDSGIAAIDKLFKGIAKPQLSSPIVSRIRYLRQHPEQLQKLKEEEEESSNKALQRTPLRGSAEG